MSWQNSILSRCSAITSTSKYTTHYTFKSKVTRPPLRALLIIINFMKLPEDGYPKNRKSIHYAVQCTVKSITSSLHRITDTLKAARSKANNYLLNIEYFLRNF